MIGCGDFVNHDDTRRIRQVSIAAVYLDRGYPTVSFAPCAGTRVSSLVVSDGVNALWSVGDGDPPNPVTTVRLFAKPPGWQKEATGAGELRAITKGREYYVFPDLSPEKPAEPMTRL